ncbi:MAG: signal peptidase II [Gudongella sp.]|nr:signal peptidase II [Gudongella sp.]
MSFIVSILIVVADQLTKYLAVEFLMDKRPIVLINNLIELHFVKNYGAAFGIMQNKRWFFIVITLIVLMAIIIFIIKNNYILHKLTKIALGSLLGGATGNLIDRIRLSYVVDFIKVDLGRLYDFPVFNIADIFIVVGTILLVLLILFDKHEVKQGR